jgi:hypothetical protein
MNFETLLHGPPVDLREFEREMSAPLLLNAGFASDSDLEDIIAAALLRRKCNPIQMHMRLKKGFNDTMTYNELHDMPSNKDAARNLAQFYVRVANTRARILNELQHMQHSEHSEHSEQLHHLHHSEQLQRAYATELENMRNKKRENREHFARIMQTIVSNPESENRSVHHDLTDAALGALDLQVHDIMERGCTSNQLRCIKIREAAMEQQIYDALIAELNALNA